MMGDQVEQYNVNNILLLDNKSSIKQGECEESDSVDNKVHISETVLTIGSGELENDDKMKQYEISNDIKTEFLSCKVEDNSIANYNVKTEKEIIADNIKMEFESALYCEHCHTYYEDYCIMCGMLVHILNKSAPKDTMKEEQVELPDGILEIQNSFGRFGIFALKVIPEGVKFGPFAGFSSTEYLWKSKGGKIVVNKDKRKYMNWMKYINLARSPFEQNLLAFQFENNLYYRSICEIQKGEELLVHFGEEYKDSINKDEAVFACTFCCLGFSCISSLIRHKTVCSNNGDGNFPNEELTQCSFCKIYLYQEEYFKHHMTYCSENNERKCVRPPMSNQTTEVTGRKTQRRQIYKREQCKYRTRYKGDLKNHINQHPAFSEVKMYKCGICYRRFMTRDSLAKHTEISHVYVGTEDLEGSARPHVKEQRQMKRFKCPLCEFCTKYKMVIKTHIRTKHLKQFDYNCESCDYKTNQKTDFGRHIKSKHFIKFDYKCESCDYKTNNKQDFEKHVKSKHLVEFDYKCESCDYKTNYKSDLENHIKSSHLKKFDYKCESCHYKTNQKSKFEKHIKSKHLKEFDYKCESCDYKSNNRSHLDMHVKTKHLVKFDYKCESCDYKTNQKSNFEKHIKSKHLKEFDYKCEACDYKTNRKSDLEKHVKTSHLKEVDYKCESCHYKTNYKSNLNMHIKTKHLVKFDYKCEWCRYETNRRSDFEKHIKSKHLKEFDYKCEACHYETNTKSDFKKHVKVSHLKEVN